MDISVILITIITYILIFHKYNKSRRARISTINGRGEFVAFRKSVFLVPTSLILTFILFVNIPNLIYLCIVIINNNLSEVISIISAEIPYAVSHLVDAGIYIFLLGDVRRFLLGKIYIIRCNCCLSACSCCSLRSKGGALRERMKNEVRENTPNDTSLYVTADTQV